jgi:hypothetical protein
MAPAATRAACHIQDTAGPRESFIHLLMMAEVGVPAWLGLLCEINPGLLIVMPAAATVHNAWPRRG